MFFIVVLNYASILKMGHFLLSDLQWIHSIKQVKKYVNFYSKLSFCRILTPSNLSFSTLLPPTKFSFSILFSPSVHIFIQIYYNIFLFFFMGPYNIVSKGKWQLFNYLNFVNEQCINAYSLSSMQCFSSQWFLNHLSI